MHRGSVLLPASRVAAAHGRLRLAGLPVVREAHDQPDNGADEQGKTHDAQEDDADEPQGPADDVSRLIAWLYHGPRWASVASVQIEERRPGSLRHRAFVMGN